MRWHETQVVNISMKAEAHLLGLGLEPSVNVSVSSGLSMQGMVPAEQVTIATHGSVLSATLQCMASGLVLCHWTSLIGFLQRITIMQLYGLCLKSSAALPALEGFSWCEVHLQIRLRWWHMAWSWPQHRNGLGLIPLSLAC